MKTMLSALFVVALVCPVPALAAEGAYPRSDLLLEPDELARPEMLRRYVVLDVRGEEAFEAGHVPTAVRVDHDRWNEGFDGGKNAKQWSRRIGELGISADTSVVVYDDKAMKDAARIWWLLRFWGVRDARLLNGGWKTWKAKGLPIEKGSAAPIEAVSFQAEPLGARLATKDELLDWLDGGRLQIVDARSFAEFCGTEPLKNKRGGAIPGARHLEWSDLVEEATHRMKSADEIRALFQKAGIDLQRPTATHCQSGGRASVMAFGLELMGAKDVRNYYRGWSEWGNAEDTPVETRKDDKQ